ncbi:MAG TPA: lamin tail domain-containing protein [Phnomibacter sp.]|nr:lamin tail domain-containing protein [Phnomibacter sp.]
MLTSFYKAVSLFCCLCICSSYLHAQARYSIVISELMADPTPTIGLPNAEWLELRNTSGNAINLQGFRLQKQNSAPSGPMPSLLLQPDSSVIVCTASQLAAMSAFGTAISVTSFPSLTNDGDDIALIAPGGALMHMVSYNINWYKNAIKADGGWTLEMIDTRNPCAGLDNWTASTDTKGGTPGKKNSVDRMNADKRSPRLLRAVAMHSQLVQLEFDEPLDSIKATTTSSYSISDGISISSATPVTWSFHKVQLQLATALAAQKIYKVSVNTVPDCSGNAINQNFSDCQLGLFTPADSNDIIVNEILFNPRQQGVDYIELYNRSQKIIDLHEILLANRSSNGQIGTFATIAAESAAIFPGEFVVCSSNPAIVAQQYTVLQPAALSTLSSMPSFPDDKGWAVVLNSAGKILDELPYEERWHFALLDNKEGIALERINYNAPTASRDNWTSAANTAGFGTPTAVNSQHRTAAATTGTITVHPRLFSPDNDGFEDVAFIDFQFPQPGYVANITIMDAAGRPVRVLQRNTTCGASGSFTWDGLNDKQQKVPLGTYIIYTEIFHLQHSRQVFKNTVAVARKF